MDSREQKGLIFLVGDKVRFKDSDTYDDKQILTIQKIAANNNIMLQEFSGLWYAPELFEHVLVQSKQRDNVNHPSHYTKGKFEVIDVLEDWKLDFHLGNVVKYIARAQYKGDFVENLEKALWYLQRRIELARR